MSDERNKTNKNEIEDNGGGGAGVRQRVCGRG